MVAIVRRDGELEIDRIGEDTERQISLELGSAPGERPVSTRPGTSDRLRQERRLADARLTFDVENGARPALQIVQQAVDDRELAVASDQRLHPPWTRIS